MRVIEAVGSHDSHSFSKAGWVRLSLANQGG